ncbi:MAG: hypothetical protein KKB90_07795 [Actinobacteria bacterium]|nr:hypothetical protein [Actinomycetota bacterium]MCG2819365.1 hypothetical protein [Actinomycetes bacterium]MBU4179089.1 hypothetical protein [Actinomycetota bacterium]MBU4218852.1 hypothetical protein [Actinomycetota bacterium]MBU4358927.1 hypothetical protein [Actinomycetota bacterium]
MSSDTTAGGIEKKGLVDGADRIARELLRNPKFKQSLIILLSSVDPQSARGLVRTLFWEDPDILLSIMGALPDLVNTGIVAAAEVAEQVKTMPSPLLQQLAQLVITKIDGFTLGEAAGSLTSIDLGLAEESSGIVDSLDNLRREFRKGYRESGGEELLVSRLNGWMEKTAAEAADKNSSTYTIIQGIGKALGENPDFVEHVLKPILAGEE